MGSSVSVGPHAGIDDIHAGFDGFEEREIAHTGGEVSMQMDRHLYCRFECFYQFISVVGGDQASHILYAYAIRAHLFQLFGFLYVIIDIVDVSAHALFGE